VLFALKARSQELRETAVEDDPVQSSRTLALKVRALLFGRPDANGWSVPPEAPPVPPSVSPDDLADDPGGPDAIRWTEPPSAGPTARPPAPSPAVTVTSAPRRRRTDWLEASVAYTATVPTDVAWVRHGVTLRLSAPFGRLPLAAFVDASFSSAPNATVDGNAVSARLWPVGAGLSLRLRRRHLLVSGGPRITLQIVDAQAHTPDGETGGARRYSAGLGAIGELDWLFSRWVGAGVMVTAEALVPRLQFAAGGISTTDLGWAQFGFSAGLVFTIP
jgi:hypothetical protein